MSTYKVGRKTSTLEIEIIPNAASFTSGFVSLGTFTHDANSDPLDPAVNDGHNHKFWHHVRDLLFTDGELNPSKYSLIVRVATAMAVSPTTVTKAAGQTQQITVTFTPANVLDESLTYESSNTDKATVSATGLITAVATGTATITVCSKRNNLAATVAVTVS